MIRRLIILLLIVGCVFGEEQKMDVLEKQMLYKQNDRSPLLAGLCALTPTMGHLYVGEWNKRLVKPINPLISGLLLITVEALYGYTDIVTGDDIYFLPVIPLALWYPLQLQDAIYLAYQHNADLYQEIYGKEYIRPPKKSLIQKWIDKKEAKKKAKTNNL